MISFSKWVENIFEKKIVNLQKGKLFLDEY